MITKGNEKVAKAKEKSFKQLEKITPNNLSKLAKDKRETKY